MRPPRRRLSPFRPRRRRVYEVPAEERTTVVEERRPPVGPPPDEPGRGIWPWLLALLLLVLGGLAAAYFLTQDDDDENGRTVVVVQVPALVDLPRTEAVRLVNRAGLRARVREVPSREARGTVVAQQPAAGDEVRRGATVSLNVSEGPPPVDVPNLVGLTEADAASRLTRLGLEANVVRVASTRPDGQVVAQNPPAGEQLAPGSSVRLNVSRGTAGTTPTATTATATTTTVTTATGTTTPAATVEIPDVVGLRELEAADTLQQAGLLADSYPVRSQEPAGTVLGQTPPGGQTARQGSVVRLNVAIGTGRRLTGAVPDVTGRNERTARRVLRRSGYTVRAIYRRATDRTDVGEVLDQSPSAGRQLALYRQVTIYVGR